MTPVLRFAPSPTGRLHLGNARAALLNWLFARHHGGRLVLRIDDTDRARSTAAFEAGIEADLRWLGLDWDEKHRQSERGAVYAEAFERLAGQRPRLPGLRDPGRARPSSARRSAAVACRRSTTGQRSR